MLNGEAPVGRETREAVERAMANPGYVPSNAARMMRSKTSGQHIGPKHRAKTSGQNIGPITGATSMSPEPTQPAGLPNLLVVQGIQKAPANSGMTLMIADTGDGTQMAGP